METGIAGRSPKPVQGSQDCCLGLYQETILEPDERSGHASSRGDPVSTTYVQNDFLRKLVYRSIKSVISTSPNSKLGTERFEKCFRGKRNKAAKNETEAKSWTGRK